MARTISVELAGFTGLFRDLEEYVVSLDRVLSRIGAGEDPRILLEYVVEYGLPSRLAQAREFVGDSLERVIGAEALEEIAEQVEAYRDKK
ncbi:hypothetical protein J7I94_32680 [Streptomyces sp. ISL-12]|uniref:hypothetical protein n=1 Tax=Streptomyces sp. ISL-12 TaxID=2819177 RepID=UPI001BE9173F|nr:hypothetical protein [Streptomyces sp. ISL-12]MBT2415241.1 hypothetical protein [Streptomyces sp. ISL-12]